MLSFLQDRPFTVQTIIAALIALEAAMVLLFFPSLWGGWLDPDLADARREIMVGTLGAAAVTSGFSGVVSTFGLMDTSLTAVRFRVRAGRPLRQNWSAVVLVGLFAMFASLTATILDSLGQGAIAIYVFQLAVALLIENACRCVWLMRSLVRLRTTEDEKIYSENN